MSARDKAAVHYGNDCLQDRRPEFVPWIWDGLVALEAITLLSGPEKAGKTTLLSLLLDRRRVGGRLLGRSVRPGRTILCSEENTRLWELRQPPLNFGLNLEYHRPRDDRSPEGWLRYIDHLLDLELDAFDLLVIDTVMNFLPGSPTSAGGMRKALDELRVVAGRPAAVLLLHQGSTARSRSRVRGPLAAFADILIDVREPPGDRLSRRRDFHGVGRYPGTIRHVAAELNPEGTDYVLLPDTPPEPAMGPALETLRQLLGQSPALLTRQEILARWPQGWCRHGRIRCGGC
jgi:hypothetical protein